jgi:hypothetical protein
MIITISVVTTCVILLSLNVYSVIKDSRFRKRFLNDFDFKLKQLSEEQYYLKTDLSKLEKSVNNLYQNMDNVKSLSSVAMMDLSDLNSKLDDMDKRVGLALMSINTLQSNFLDNMDIEF